MHVLVTGGAGFIGSHLVRWLVDQGHHVRVLDNLSTGRLASLGPALHSLEFIQGDICDLAAVQAALQQIDLVFHLAAFVSVTASVAQPLHAQAVNASGTLHVLECARQEGVRRVVHASSSAVYGNTAQLPISEVQPPHPLSPYAVTKLAAEHLGQLYTDLYALETVALRFFNVYGPHQTSTSPYAAVIPAFIARLRAREQPIIHGDGQQTRDFVFVGDVVQALWRAATTPDIAGGVFNVGSGSPKRILELAHIVGDVLGISTQPTFAPARAGEIRHSHADTSLFADQAGFRVAVCLRAGIEATVLNWSDGSA